MTTRTFSRFVLVAAVTAFVLIHAQGTIADERRGIIPHAALLKRAVPDTANQEVAVYHAEYEPGGVNPRHFHPAAVTFHIIAGTGVWQEDGKPAITLRAGDSLHVPAGTTHAHWNPS